MPAAPQFPPLIVRARYQSDGSAKTAFLADVDKIASEGQRKFATTFDSIEAAAGSAFRGATAEAKRQLDQMLSNARNTVGSLDLGVAQARAAANAAQARAVAARELATATALAAREQNDFTQQARLSVAAAQALAREEEQAAAAARSHAAALEQVQERLNRQASATDLVVGATRRSISANDNHTASIGAQRAGFQQLSFQIGDMATMFSLGASAQQIFASQAGQTVQAISLMSGGASKFATFMQGPWGAALTAGTLILSPFIAKLFESEKAEKAAALASDGLTNAQSVMGEMFDLVTGKIARQNDMLRLNVQLTAMNLRAEAIAAKSRADAATIAAGRPDILTSVGEMLAQGAGAAPVPTARPPKTVARDVLERVAKGQLEGSAALRWAEKADFSGSAISQKDFIAALTAAVEARAKGQTADLIEQSLKTGVLADEFRRAGSKGSGGRKGSGVDEAKRLAEFGESAAEKIARITEEFDRQPRAIDRVEQKTRELDKLYEEMGKKKLLDPGTIAAFEKARAAISDFSTRPFQEMVQASREQLEVQGRVLAGRGLEAEMLQKALALQDKQGVVTTDQLAAIRNMVLAQRQVTAEQERQNSLRQIEARLVDDTRANLRQSLSEIARGGGIGAVGDLLKRQFGLLRENALDSLFQSVFGDFFTTAKDRALGFDLVKAASRDQVDVINEVTRALRELDQAAGGAATALTSTSPLAIGASQPDTLEALFDRAFASRTGAGAVSGSIVGALAAGNDNAAPITVIANPSRGFVKDITAGLAGVFLDKATASKIGAGIADGLTGQGHGAAYGLLAGGLVVGKGGSQLGSSIGGALGQALGTEVLGKALGSFAGPIGAIAGGILGSLLGGALSGAKTGSATLGTGGTISLSGTSGSRKQAASGLGDSVLSSLDRIAEALGGSATGAYAVSIGIRDKNYRVDTSGSGITKTKKGAIDFGQDAEAATKAAIADAISDGAIQGIRATTQAILKASKDIDKGLQDALDFESIFTRLKEYTDPVGAALDTVNKEFSRLNGILKANGGTAEEAAQLEQLYGLEREKAITQAREQYTSGLQGLLDDLTIGDSGLSLRSRQQSALAAYQPLAARVGAGDVLAFDDYASAAKTLLDVSRQLFGSQSGYFDLFNEISGLTKSTLDRQNAIADTAAGRDSPFSSSAVPSNDNANVVSAIGQQTAALLDGLGSHLDAMNRNLGTIILQGQANGTTGGPTFTFPSFF